MKCRIRWRKNESGEWEFNARVTPHGDLDDHVKEYGPNYAITESDCDNDFEWAIEQMRAGIRVVFLADGPGGPSTDHIEPKPSAVPTIGMMTQSRWGLLPEPPPKKRRR